MVAFAFPSFIDSERHAVGNIIQKFRDAVRHKEFGEAALRGVFRRFDKSKTGFVTPMELRRGIASMGIEFSDYDIRRLLERLDPEGDYGKVNYVEFAALVREASVREQQRFGYSSTSASRGMVSKQDLASALQRRLRDMVIESCTLEATCDCNNKGVDHVCEYALWRHRPFAPSSNPNSVAVPMSRTRRVGHVNGVKCDVPWKEGSLELLAFRDFQEFGRRQEVFERSKSAIKGKRHQIANNASRAKEAFDTMTLGEFQLAVTYVLGNDFTIHPSDVRRLLDTIDVSARGHVHKDDFIAFLKRGKPTKRDIELVADELRRRVMAEWRSGRSSFGDMYERFCPKRRRREIPTKNTISAPPGPNDRAWCFTFGPTGLMEGAISFGIPLGNEEASILFNKLEGTATHARLGVAYRDFLAFLSPTQAAATDALVNSFRDQFKRAMKRGESIKRTFARYDPRSSGTVDMPSFKACLRELKVRASDEDVEQVVDHFNLDYANDFSLVGFKPEKSRNAKGEEHTRNNRVRHEVFVRYMLSTPLYSTTIATQTAGGLSNANGSLKDKETLSRWEPHVSRSVEALPRGWAPSPTRTRIMAAGRNNAGGNPMRWSMPL